mmetsp:Transcript_1281/g.3039  ORF Transcript_1281/g.3039 Transcript_1281/m.3039 type:complete len:81 (+) Transcript_1281:29-271(+)
MKSSMYNITPIHSVRESNTPPSRQHKNIHSKYSILTETRLPPNCSQDDIEPNRVNFCSSIFVLPSSVRSFSIGFIGRRKL